MAASLRIEALLGKRPSALSGGDLQRVAIGRALVRRPKALLMDEPIGALDAKLREDMRAELKRLHIENGTTSVYVTHDQVEAMSLADRVAVMNDGVLQQVGTPSEVYLNPVNLFVAQFVGSPVMNVMPAEIRAEGGETAVSIGGGPAFGFPGELAPRLGAALPGGARAGGGRAAGGGEGGARGGAGAAAGGGAVHRAARRARHRGPEGRRAVPQGAHAERVRAARRGRRSGRGSTCGQVHFFDATTGNVLELGLGAWLRSGSTASSKRFVGQQALDGLTLTIADGEFFVMLGPTGAGKTTTLRLIAGLEKPDAGTVSHRRRGHRRLERGAARRGAGLPVLLALPALHGAAEPGLSAEVAGAELLRRRDRAAGGAGGEDAADRAPARPQDRPALGRRDAAGVDRAGDRARPERVPDGRAAVEPRRQAAGGAALGAEGPAELARGDLPLRDPRPDRGDVDGRPGRGAERGASWCRSARPTRSTTRRATPSSRPSWGRRR